jgi:hypothetical protein
LECLLSSLLLLLYSALSPYEQQEVKDDSKSWDEQSFMAVNCFVVVGSGAGGSV